MSINKIEDIATFFLTLFPVMKKKILPPLEDLYQKEITPTHFSILMLLEEAGKLPTTEIGKRLLILKSNLSPLIQKLITKGYVSREIASHDRRIVYILLTDEGKDYLNHARSGLHEAIKKRFEDLKKEEVDQLYEAVKNMNEVLKKL